MATKTREEWIIWIMDNALLIILLIVVLYFGIKGHYTDRVIETVEVCRGVPYVNLST